MNMEAITIKNLFYSFRNISSTKIILFGFLLLIFIGTVLLCMPFSSKTGETTPVDTSFFTATSAVCVTGLIKVDTFTHWSVIGQAVILALIQIGGMGFMTVCITIVSITKRKISYSSRAIMQNSISAPQVGGIVKMTRFVIAGTLLVELLGAVLLSFSYCPRFGIGTGIWMSVFHSISAFCNAGFDLMGGISGEFSSLTSFSGDWYSLSIIMVLIVLGGLGFFVWSDIIASRGKRHKMKLQTKLVLTVSILLIVGGALLIFLFERRDSNFTDMSISQQICASLFQSVSARTAGFNTIGIGAMAQPALVIMIILMYIGGSPGSTAGGMKTTTFAVLALSVVSVFKKKKSSEAFGRRMEDKITRVAVCVLTLYLLLSATVSLIISSVESIPFLNAWFESASAIATVGITTGITTHLSLLSSILLAVLMIFGRVGSLTMLLAFASNKTYTASIMPEEKVQIG